MAELADALRSGRSELYAHVGSTPTFGIDTNKKPLEETRAVLRLEMGRFSLGGNPLTDKFV